MADKPEGGQTQAQKTPMTKDAAARIQSAEAKENDGKVVKGGFAARAQAAAARNENANADKPEGEESLAPKKNPMTTEAAARIQGNEAKEHGGGVPKDGFAARAQAAAARNENAKN